MGHGGSGGVRRHHQGLLPRGPGLRHRVLHRRQGNKLASFISLNVLGNGLAFCLNWQFYGWLLNPGYVCILGWEWDFYYCPFQCHQFNQFSEDSHNYSKNSNIEKMMIFSLLIWWLFLFKASFEAVKKWRKKVEDECGTTIPTVLVQNKIDLMHQSVVAP